MSDYTKGDRIQSLNELIDQKFIIYRDKVYHIGWVLGWQLNYALKAMRHGIYKADKEKKVEK